MSQKLPKKYESAVARFDLRKKSKLLYWWKYTFVLLFHRFLKRFELEAPEQILHAAFTTFVAYSLRRFKVPYPEDFNTEDEFIEALDTHVEVVDLIDFWRTRDHANPDRVKDDQMMIRLIRIRHKLNYEDR